MEQAGALKCGHLPEELFSCLSESTHAFHCKSMNHFISTDVASIVSIRNRARGIDPKREPVSGCNP